MEQLISSLILSWSSSLALLVLLFTFASSLSLLSLLVSKTWKHGSGYRGVHYTLKISEEVLSQAIARCRKPALLLFLVLVGISSIFNTLQSLMYYQARMVYRREHKEWERRNADYLQIYEAWLMKNTEHSR